MLAENNYAMGLYPLAANDDKTDWNHFVNYYYRVLLVRNRTPIFFNLPSVFSYGFTFLLQTAPNFSV